MKYPIRDYLRCFGRLVLIAGKDSALSGIICLFEVISQFLEIYFGSVVLFRTGLFLIVSPTLFLRILAAKPSPFFILTLERKMATLL